MGIVSAFKELDQYWPKPAPCGFGKEKLFSAVFCYRTSCSAQNFKSLVTSYLNSADDPIPCSHSSCVFPVLGPELSSSPCHIAASLLLVSPLMTLSPLTHKSLGHCLTHNSSSINLINGNPPCPFHHMVDM